MHNNAGVAIIEGTNIPVDPRKRTKNHARLDLTVWVEYPDEDLAKDGYKSAVDAMRDLQVDILEDFQEATGLDELVKYEIRVSQ